ncbi:MAG: nicotinate (nicotinamide) nucleotide adenylyltransferase [Spirochaetaceae bacterium]|nr:nicotinate (nicotinamide) nucleotide adenylyltransferase [Spirochaetaceae bacterium]
MKYAIIGGSFNPFHNGHLQLARSVQKLGFDRVIFVPAFQSPFKQSGQSGNATERLSMLLAAVCADVSLTVDPCELKREGVSYTIDTVRDILERYTTDEKPALVIGDDLVPEFHLWRGAQEISENCNIIIASRIYSGNQPFPYPYTMLGNDVLPVSSHEIRDLIAKNGAWQNLVPKAVKDIIEDQGFYNLRGGARSYPNPPPLAPASSAQSACGVFRYPPAGHKDAAFAIETQVRALLKPYRFVHSRNVALHCYDLCKRFGIDPYRGYIAGICHDVCKEHADIKKLAKKDKLPFSALEQKKPSLLHGRAGAIFIQENLGIEDSEIIEAVRFHTTGTAGMCTLAKIVYLCDKIEAGRNTVDTKLRRLAFCKEGENLTADELFNIILNATCKYLVDSGLDLADETIKLASNYKGSSGA